LLIEDNAQWFPEPLPAAGLEGDLVCLSFGRGKPVSLLGGGVLLARDSIGVSIPAIGAPVESGGLSLRVHLYNLLLSRRLYPLVNRNPFFELGKTAFKPLGGVGAMDPLRQRCLLDASRHYVAGSRSTENAWERLFPGSALPARLGDEGVRQGRLLRYPILCRDRAYRDRLWQLLDDAGLGASAMYRVALPEVAGVAGKFRLAGDYEGAREFAGRLLTLPVHGGVAPADIERAERLVRSSV
jgi:hypothetical protein